MEKLLTTEEFRRMTAELDKVKHRCNCGHRVIVPESKNKEICNWCGHYVFKDKREEFRYRVKEKIR